MAVQCPTSSEYLSVASGLVTPAANFTVFGWVATNALPVGTSAFQTALVLFTGGSTDYSQPYLWVGVQGHVGAATVSCETDTGEVDAITPVVSTWLWFAATYIAATHVVTFIVNGTVMGTFTRAFGAFTATVAGGDTAGSSGGLSLAYYREYESALTLDQLNNEAAATSALVLATQDTPLPDASDLTSLTGAGSWTGHGSLATVPGPQLNTPGTGVTTTVAIRRLRRTPHVAQTQKRITWNRLQVDIQPGIGNTIPPGDDPQVMLRWSNNGGRTWSNEHWVSAGKIGMYLARAQWYVLGSSRDRVLEIVVTDPVTPWVILQAFGDLSVGTS